MQVDPRTLQSYSERLYQNQGNPELLTRLQCTSGWVLDVGCGAGDNARLLGEACEALRIVGITASPNEASIARKHMQNCLVADIENEVPSELEPNSFDCILFSHVLEHLREPSRVLASFVPYLKQGGQVLIAVPNIANFRSRWELVMWQFEYQETGVFDETHLRFFTYHSADQFLLRDVTGLELVEKAVTGSVPLWAFRRYFFPNSLRQYLDRKGCRLFPNIFGGQVILNLINRPVVSME